MVSARGVSVCTYTGTTISFTVSRISTNCAAPVLAHHIKRYARFFLPSALRTVQTPSGEDPSLECGLPRIAVT